MAGSMLPPDVRAQARVRRGGGIGGGTHENAVAAEAREVALGNAPVEPPAQQAEPEPEKASPSTCLNPRCGIKVEPAWDYCASCGQSVTRGGAGRQLGIEFKPQDLEEYLFRGYIVREVKIVGQHKATLKSAQPKDMREIDDLIMNGEWIKSATGSDKRVSDFYLRQMNAMCITAACLVKLDGNPVGGTLQERMDWIEERGAALVDILANKVSLFNQAITEFLSEETTILGS